MANTASPFGFRFAFNVDQRTQNAATATRQIDPTYATAIYRGDPVTSGTDGYIIRASAGTTQINGIFAGCKFYNPSLKQMQWSPYWPGTSIGSSYTVEAYVINDPGAVFMVQAGATAIGLAHIDANVQFNLGTGSAATGQSGAYVESPNSTSTLPFRVYGLITSPPGLNGTDPTTGYNNLLVTFNNQDFKSLTGIN